MKQTFPTLVTNPLTQYPQAIERATQVKLLVLDVDGVLTDGALYVGPDGKEHLKVFDSLDGHGIKLLTSTGVQVAIITGRTSEMVLARAKELGITQVQMGAKDKAKALETLLAQLQLQSKDCAAVGDDWPDLSVLNQVALACCPAQAHDEVKKRCHYVCTRSGGQGAVREVCDLLLQAQGHYERLLSEAL